MAASHPSAWGTIGLAGLVAGSLDILGAFVTNAPRGVGPVRILQSVSSGLLGAPAFEGGAGTAALGLLLHFVIAFGAAATFWAASRRFGFLVARPILAGAAYGIAIYAFMNGVVLPLSAVPFRLSYSPTTLATGLLVHVFCVGLPIALVVRRHHFA